MSDIGALGTGIPTSAIPAEVKKAGEKATDTYKAALGFEQMLVKQLTKQLSDSSALGGELGRRRRRRQRLGRRQLARGLPRHGLRPDGRLDHERRRHRHRQEPLRDSDGAERHGHDVRRRSTAANGATTTDSGTGVAGANDATSGGLLS